MACCFLAALILSHVLAIWRDRRRIALYAFGLLVSMTLLGWQIQAHAHHLRQFIADAEAFVRGEDPAVVALRSTGVDCAPQRDGQQRLHATAVTYP